MFTVITILNPLTYGSTTKEYVWEKGKTLSEYIGYDGECIVACNQEPIKLPPTEIFPARKEVYTVMVIPMGTDSRAWGALGTVVSFIPGWGKAALFIGANLLALYLRDKDKDQDTSQSYSWGHVSSPSAAKGIAMPIVYGKARVRPILKNRYVTVDGDKQYLYALYGVAAHRVDERVLPLYLPGAQQEEVFIPSEPGRSFRYTGQRRSASQPLLFYATDGDGHKAGDLGPGWQEGHGTASFVGDILINGRAIQDYHDDVRWETRPGLAEQTVITDFDVTYVNIVTNTSLWIDYPEVNRGAAAFEFDTSSMTILWDKHPLSLHGIQYTMEAGSQTFSPADIGYTTYIVYDPDISTTKYGIRRRASTPPPTGYIIMSFEVEAADFVNKDLTYLNSEFPTTNDWVIPVTSLTDAHNIELTFEFPNGLFGQNAAGKVISQEARLFMQYQVIGSDTWINFHSFFTDASGYWVGDPSGINTYHIKRVKQDSFYITRTAVPPNGVLLNPGTEYRVRVTASSPSAVKLVNVATIIYGEEDEDEDWPGFTYPGEPLLGIKALASGQVSGKLDVQVDVERSKVWVYNTRTVRGVAAGWVRGNADNHAWAVYDILAQGHPDHPAYPTAGNDHAEASYGCGIDKNRLDYESFRTWAENIGDLDYELNTVFDTFMTAWDAILRICQEGRGMVYTVGSTIFAFTDKAADPVQLFTAGNIHADTLVHKYVGTRDRANSVEVSYYDAERNYEKTLLIMRTADWDSSTDLNIPESITLYGTTGSEQAESIARFLLTGNELLNSVLSFGVDVDALAAQAGDVVEVQHDLLSTGEGGRIVSVVEHPVFTGAYTLTMDRTLSVTSGQQYQLKIYHNDGTIETKSGITSGNVSGAVISFGTVWSWDKVPEGDEPYSFGISGAHTKKYRITEISRTTELMRTLTLVQYDEDLYTGYVPGDADVGIDSGRVVSKRIPVTPGAIGDVANTLNFASNLRLQETLSRNRLTGEYESSIVVTWDTVTGDPRGKWEVWFRDVDAADVDWQGEWEAGTYGHDEKVEKDGKTYISLEDRNISIPFLVDSEV